MLANPAAEGGGEDAADVGGAPDGGEDGAGVVVAAVGGDVAEEGGHGGAGDLVNGRCGDEPLPGGGGGHADGGEYAEAPTGDDDAFAADFVGVLGDGNVEEQSQEAADAEGCADLGGGCAEGGDVEGLDVDKEGGAEAPQHDAEEHEAQVGGEVTHGGGL